MPSGELQGAEGDGHAGCMEAPCSAEPGGSGPRRLGVSWFGPFRLHKAGLLGISQMRSLISGRIYKNVNDQSQTLFRENVSFTLNLYFRPYSRKSQYFFHGCS